MMNNRGSGEARVHREDNWPIVLGLEFAGRGNFNLISAWALVDDYLAADPSGEWREWFPIASLGELSVILRYRHEVTAPAMRVSRTKEGWSASCRLPAGAYSGLDVFGMMRHVCEHVSAALEKISIRAELRDPPCEADALLSSVQEWSLSQGITDPVAHQKAIWDAAREDGRVLTFNVPRLEPVTLNSAMPARGERGPALPAPDSRRCDAAPRR